MKYFTIKELTESQTAIQKGIDNNPNPKIVKNLTNLVHYILDPLRQAYGKPIRINGAYRCEALNKAIGGSKTSKHLEGLAADITVGSPLKNKELFNLIIELDLPFDQLIDEKNFKWIHVAFSDKPRKQIMHYG